MKAETQTRKPWEDRKEVEPQIYFPRPETQRASRALGPGNFSQPRARQAFARTRGWATTGAGKGIGVCPHPFRV